MTPAPDDSQEPELSLYQHLHGHPAGAMERAKAIGAAAAGKQVVAVSACLMGQPVRYDGGHKHAPDALGPLLADPHVIVLPICPEMLAGMGCPRPPVHFASGDGGALLAGHDARIVDGQGQERTAAMVNGAERALGLCRAAGVTAAVLKEHSPSCGLRTVHGPAGRQPGQGVFAARMAEQGVTLVNEMGQSPLASPAPSP
jgi:uncharacterized protein YbbK (DUF523 family)